MNLIEEPSQACLKRVKRDLADFHADQPPGVFMAPDEKDITTVHAVVAGAAGTSYEGGFFHLLIKYPLVRFLTTDGGHGHFNPHVLSNSHICLSLRSTMVGQPWTPTHNVPLVAVSIQPTLDGNVERDYTLEAFEHIITSHICGTI
ncbi:ubiquitin-conjugating enzyme E2 Z-like [Dermacentor silvarum]|uniref:ubiquitin-conjugating enzyme E2 Z-like n=1 Tax=Dermacentor silvarum TaxID=543639 RepID=UPI001898AA8F|nr:ubiquitin-conjugating enzyme E2 Z-like [Dermacentor silvarum]